MNMQTKQVCASQQLSLLPATTMETRTKTTTIEATITIITAATHLRNKKINLTEKLNSARRTKAE